MSAVIANWRLPIGKFGRASLIGESAHDLNVNHETMRRLAISN
jgi:hypothetical protein